MKFWFLASLLVCLPVIVLAFDVANLVDVCVQVAQGFLPVATAVFVVTSALGLAIRLRSQQPRR